MPEICRFVSWLPSIRCIVGRCVRRWCRRLRHYVNRRRGQPGEVASGKEGKWRAAESLVRPVWTVLRYLDLSDDLVSDAVRIRLLGIGQAAKSISDELTAK